MVKRTFNDEAALRAFAREFSRSLRPGDVVALSGQLGSGKTTFVQGALSERAPQAAALSPTFTFWHRYPADPPIDHLDLYRVDDPAELRELGLDDAFAGESIVFIEWPEHAPQLLPQKHYTIAIGGAGDEPRTLQLHHNE